VAQPLVPPQNIVPSLLDRMVDGNEYGSIVSLVPKTPDIIPEIRRAIDELEQIRGRRCVLYVANQVNPDVKENTSIHAGDHLPFCEMLGQIPQEQKELDIFIATPGGSADQVNLFVEAMRPRFDKVDFIVPYKAMSAGTLWALSGDRIWMDSRAFLGPLDPQVPGADGQYVPAQALVLLLNEIQRIGQDAINRKENPPWAYVRLLDKMDQKQVGAALSSTGYVVKLASQYLDRYKFAQWVAHGNGQPVTAAERKVRAEEAATQLASHDRWKAHGHAISRDVLWQELKIKIDHPESVTGLQRAIRRLWALVYYTFEKAPMVKVLLSKEYAFARQQFSLVVKQ
jgi:hypothetical protein